ncbi:MAG: hypothetical protein R3223_07255 [Longimicrobiales bacterium]|nr:hypothetical protein [Longimicrobiales bacterium]
MPERPPFGEMAAWGSVGSLAGVGIGLGITYVALGNPADDYGAGMMLLQLGGGLSILGSALAVWGSGSESGVGFGHAFLSSLFGSLPAAVSASSSPYAYPFVHGFVSAGLVTWMASNRGDGE